MGKLTTQDVAAKFAVTTATVRMWCQQKLFPHAILENTPRGPVWIIPEEDTLTFVKPPIGRPTKQKNGTLRGLNT
jgi:hypothetical protein